MKNSLFVGLVTLMIWCPFKQVYSGERSRVIDLVKGGGSYAPSDDYLTTVVFKAGYKIGDFIEFVGVLPISAGSSGNYEISISYTRGSIAAAATHWASVSHANPSLWREVGRTNNNGYVGVANNHNFTVDCNTQSSAPRFRLRAINTLGVLTSDISVSVKVRSININSAWTPLSGQGNDITVDKFLPMTIDWSLYVGTPFDLTGAKLAIKATSDGNIGIGTSNTSGFKLAVAGGIIAESVKVQLQSTWPDYVFTKSYLLPTLQEAEKHILENGHLAGIPSAKEIENNGIDLGEMNGKLLKKIEELTLYLIDQNKKIIELQSEVNKVKSKL